MLPNTPAGLRQGAMALLPESILVRLGEGRETAWKHTRLGQWAYAMQLVAARPLLAGGSGLQRDVSNLCSQGTGICTTCRWSWPSAMDARGAFDCGHCAGAVDPGFPAWHAAAGPPERAWWPQLWCCRCMPPIYPCLMHA